MEQTELDMVNALLEIIEETSIQAIDETHPDVTLALDLWDKQSVITQARGWWFNRESFDLEPDAITDIIYVPDGTLEIDCVSTKIVKRGRKLYDNENHTYEFTEGLTVDCIMEWALEDLPPIVYSLILTLCKIDMVMGRDQDATKLDVLNTDSARQNAYAQKADVRYSDPNRLHVNNAALLLSRQPMRYY